MIIEFIDGGSRSTWLPGFESSFVSRDYYGAAFIKINQKSEHWRQHYAHEVAHLLLCKRTDCSAYCNYDYTEHDILVMRIETMAHRVAKSICKEKYWSDKEAIRGLRNCSEKMGITDKINWAKLKIIPLNKGIRI